MNDKNLEKWVQMSEEERRKWNGYNGFLNSNLLCDGTAFSRHIKKREIKKKNKSRIWKNGKS